MRSSSPRTTRRRFKTLARCGVSSFAAVALEFLVLTFLVSVLHLPYLAAAILAAVAYLGSNFVLNRQWAFRADEGALSSQFARHIAVATVGSALVIGLLWLLVHVAGVPYQLGWLAAGMIAFVGWTYPMNRFFTYRPRRAEPEVQRLLDLQM